MTNTALTTGLAHQINVEHRACLTAASDSDRLYPLASDDPALIFSDPARYERMVQRHRTYSHNRSKWLDSEFWPLVEKTKRGEDVPLSECVAMLGKSRDIINGIQRWRFKVMAMIGCTEGGDG